MRGNRRLAVLVVATLLAGLVVVVPVHAATIRNVPSDYPSISAAIAASTSGDIVLVAPGTYIDNFTVPDGVTVESSAGPETTSVRGVNFLGPIAIINSGGTVRGLTLMDSGGNAVAGAAKVQGLLEDSRILGNGGCLGSAIELDGGTVQNNYFDDNVSICFSPPVIYGGGSIVGNEFDDNGHSPPIRLASGSTLVEGNYFHDAGIVIMSDGSDLQAIIRNNLVIATGSSSDGLVQIFDWLAPTGPTIVNNTFIRTEGIGPLLVTRGYDSSTTIANNVFAGPSGSTLMECVNDYDSLLPSIQANDFWTPSGPGLAGACTGLVGTSGNVSVDPKFVSPLFVDYHLRAYSPLIDAGVNGVAMAPDVDGDARPLDGNEDGAAVVDIGFDESTLALGISPDAIDFGNVAIGRTVSQSITASNLGSGPIAIDTIEIETFGDFEIVSETCPAGTLAVAASCTIQVAFTPSTYGHGTATVTIGGPGDTGSLAILVAGTGAYPLTVTPPSFEYPNALVGVAIAGSVTIENDGAPVSITGVSLSGTTPGDVTIGAQTCTAAPIPQDGSCVIPFTFKAADQGVRNAIITASGVGIGDIPIPINAIATFVSSNVSWGSTTAAGPSYTWNGGGALGRTVQSGAQRLHLAYSTNRVGGQWATNSGPKVGVYYIRNTTGTTWSTPKRLNPTTQHAAVLGLAAAGSRVYAVWVSQTKWVNYSPTAPRRLYVRVNTSHGASTAWRSTVALTTTTGRVDYPTIAATGTDAHIAWTDANSGSVRVASSRDNGVHWTKSWLGSTTITFADGRTAFPTVAADGSSVAVCWLSDVFGTIRCRVSTNRGVSWGTTTTVGSQADGFFSVAVRGTRIAVVWTTPSDDIVLRQRIGGVWDTAAVLPNDGSADLIYGARVDLRDTNRIAVSWSSETGAATTLRWVESPNSGALWFATSAISTNASARARNDWQSVVWPSAGTRYVVWNGWTEATTNYKLYMRKGTGTPTVPTGSAQAWVAPDAAVTVLDPNLFQAGGSSSR